MAPTVVSDVAPKTQASEIDPKAAAMAISAETEAKTIKKGNVAEEEVIRVETEAKTGMYVDNNGMKEVLKGKMGDKPPTSPTNELYQLVIDSDVAITVKMVIVYGSLTMKMVKKNYDEGLGSSIKKLNGGRKSEELSSKVMGNASDDIKLPSGSEIEISRLPGYILQTKGKHKFVELINNISTVFITSAVIFRPSRTRDRRRFPAKARRTSTVIQVTTVARSATTSKAAAQRTNTATSNARLKRAHMSSTKRANRHITVLPFIVSQHASTTTSQVMSNEYKRLYLYGAVHQLYKQE
ncbi:hypothetical protein Syun_024226 [Stephania yunnanensis]|uniref:Uncharacterized protein n=1 Tax=Stephania yunnanensis TaxID=152371 RepID=A0AAP0I3Z5_9MAGN